MDDSTEELTELQSVEEKEEEECTGKFLKLRGLTLVPYTPAGPANVKLSPGAFQGRMDFYEISDWEEYIPPENLAMVVKGIYRAAMPKKKNFAYLKRMGLRSILCLFQEDYPQGNLAFMKDHGIQLLQFGVPGNKEPFLDIPDEVIREALGQLLDVRNHPILIHCNKGKHRTGCLVGCLRKVQNWSH
eukprot:Ihof_evm1s798 gene=Ihof_evmTU1s798